MSAASESSGTGFSSGSGRSTPDDARFPASASSSLASNSHPHAFSPFGSAWGPRRSSTPATSFLTPRFWGGSSGGSSNTNTASSGGAAGHRIEEHRADPTATAANSSSHLQSGSQLHQSLSHGGGGVIHESSDEAASPSFINIPRRVSFGHALGGNRLGAFSALGLGPSSPYWTQSTSPQKSHDAAAGKPSMARTGTDDGALSSANTTPAPSMPSSPVQKPQKTRTVYLPGPDGICVESRAKRGQ